VKDLKSAQQTVEDVVGREHLNIKYNYTTIVLFVILLWRGFIYVKSASDM
jgi:hypothetical protein